MKQLHLHKIILILAAIPAALSCRKFVSIPPPDLQVQTVEIFRSDAAALSALSGLYNRMRTVPLTLMNGGVTLYPALTADEIVNAAPNPELDMFAANDISPLAATPLSRLWASSYGTIYAANALLEGLDKGTITDTLKHQLKGEALVIRAFHYFYLANLFGAVPLVTTTDYRVNESMERTAVSKIWEQVIDDLETAATLLRFAYPAPGRTRINLGAAQALLARVYLYTGDWEGAENAATSVLNNNQYALLSTASIGNVFLSASTETVWQLLRETSNTTIGETFIPTSRTVVPPYVILPALLNVFETGDQRRAKWIDSNRVGTPLVTHYYPAKYKQRTLTSGAPTELLVVLRLGELYLLRAEARLHRNNLDGARADINTIRNRAGLSNTAAVDAASLEVAIARERQRELFTEWGHRWFDLKRTQMAQAVLAPLKGNGWQAADTLYPIPQEELLRNPALVQNPGY